jgi:hypothetical protein
MKKLIIGEKVSALNVNEMKGIIGGNYFVEEINSLSPPDSEMQHLVTFSSEFFPYNFFDKSLFMSVFISLKKQDGEFLRTEARKYTLNLQEDKNIVESKYNIVFLYDKEKLILSGNEGFLDNSYQLYLEDFTKAELQEELQTMEENGYGIECSKYLGFPYFLQDVIYFEPKFDFLVQLNEYDLKRVDKQFENVFQEGLGYIFVSKNIRKSITPNRIGYFFIQF